MTKHLESAGHCELPRSVEAASERRGVRFNELPEAQPGEELYREWNTYRREVGRLLCEGSQGRHVLIKGEEILGLFDTFEAAREAGLKRFFPEPFFVHLVRSEEPYLQIRGLNYPCLS